MAALDALLFFLAALAPVFSRVRLFILASMAPAITATMETTVMAPRRLSLWW